MKKSAVIMFVAMMSLVMLTGCGSGKESEENADVSNAVNSDTGSEVASEEDLNEVASEEGLEVASEVSSEMVSEEIKENEFYSAEEVMALIDELIAEYPYNDPEHIKCLVIGANLDYIEAKELEILLSTYGYTMEELAELYGGGNGAVYDAILSCADTIKYHSGQSNLVSDEHNFVNRITLESIMLSNKDKEFAKEVDAQLLNLAQFNGFSMGNLTEISNYETSTSGEELVVSFVKSFVNETFEYYGPYEDYVSN